MPRAKTTPRTRARKPGRGGRPAFVSGPRPTWSGTLSFGLVTVPVDLYPAVHSVSRSLRMLAPDGTPLQRRYVCSRDGKQLDADDIVRGFERDDDEFVVLTDEELEAVEPRKSRDIQLREFVGADDIDPVLFERAYVLTPAARSAKPYRLLAAVMERTGKVGIATFVMRSKEHLAAILARGGVLWAETLRFADELRTPDDVGLDAKRPRGHAAELRAFRDAIDELAAEKLDPGELRDEFEERLADWVAGRVKAGEGLIEAPADAVDEDEHEAVSVDGEPDLEPRNLLEVIQQRLAGKPPARDGDEHDEPRSRSKAAKRTKAAQARGARPQPSAEALAALTKAELYARAKAAEIPGRSDMTKAELVAALDSSR